jgi:hypothetical protein
VPKDGPFHAFLRRNDRCGHAAIGVLRDDPYIQIDPGPRIAPLPKHDFERWRVTDDWPERVPVTHADDRASARRSWLK